MVQHHDQHLLVRAAPSSWARTGISADRSNVYPKRLGDRRRRGRSAGPVQLRPGQDPLVGLAVRGREDGAQRLVPGEDVAQRRARARPGPARRSGGRLGMLYAALGPSNWCRNHSRRCANDSGSRSGADSGAHRRPGPVGVGRPGGRPARPRWASRTAPAAAGRRRARPGSARPAVRRAGSARRGRRSRRRRLPSPGPAPGRNSRQGSSRSPAGARAGRPVVVSGSGSALRSSLPFAVSGSSGSTTTAAGTM